MGTKLKRVVATINQKQIIYSESLILRTNSHYATLMVEDLQLHLILVKDDLEEKELIRVFSSEKEVTITLSPTQSMYLDAPIFFATLDSGEDIYLDLVASKIAEDHYVVTVNLLKD